jgi:hypothetical protein
VIEAASSGYAPPTLRLDRINSRDLLSAARQLYFSFLADGSSASEPLGVVLSPGEPGCWRGRVVFSAPVLLPDEEFVALALLRRQTAGSGGLRRGPGRSRVLRPLAP